MKPAIPRQHQDPSEPQPAPRGGATLMIKLSSATAELLADVALARSVTHRGDTTIAGVIEDLVHRSRGQLEEEAEAVKQKRRREHK